MSNEMPERIVLVKTEGECSDCYLNAGALGDCVLGGVCDEDFNYQIEKESSETISEDTLSSIQKSANNIKAGNMGVKVDIGKVKEALVVGGEEKEDVKCPMFKDGLKCLILNRGMTKYRCGKTACELNGGLKDE
jgi:hypothetical protein